MPAPELTGAFPVYNENGVPVALVHCYKGYEERCRRRALEVGKAIAEFDGEKMLDNSQGLIPTFGLLGAVKAAKPKGKRRWR